MQLPDWTISMLSPIFPWVGIGKANKKIRVKIKDIEKNGLINFNDYMVGYEKLEMEDLNGFFEKTIQVKKSLEDKLKTSLFSVTVGIAILTSTISLLFSDGILMMPTWLKAIIFISGSMSVMFMIVAGVFAMRTISGYIRVYQLFPDDYSNATEAEIKTVTAECTELNSLSNIIRQNFMNVSFRCIINALFALTVLFFIMGSTAFVVKTTSVDPIAVDVKIVPSADSIQVINSKLLTLGAYAQEAFTKMDLKIKNNNKLILELSKDMQQLDSITKGNKSNDEHSD